MVNVSRLYSQPVALAGLASILITHEDRRPLLLPSPSVAAGGRTASPLRRSQPAATWLWLWMGIAIAGAGQCRAAGMVAGAKRAQRHPGSLDQHTHNQAAGGHQAIVGGDLAVDSVFTPKHGGTDV